MNATITSTAGTAISKARSPLELTDETYKLVTTTGTTAHPSATPGPASGVALIVMEQRG